MMLVRTPTLLRVLAQGLRKDELYVISLIFTTLYGLGLLVECHRTLDYPTCKLVNLGKIHHDFRDLTRILLI